jgi:hypothetical protein
MQESSGEFTLTLPKTHSATNSVTHSLAMPEGELVTTRHRSSQRELEPLQAVMSRREVFKLIDLKDQLMRAR